MDDRSVMTIDELARYLKVSKSTLYKLVRAGKIPGQKVGKHWRFHREVVDAWLGDAGDRDHASRTGRLGSRTGERRYLADLTAGSLKIPESRIIADLMLKELDREGWHQAIIDENVLQSRSPATAKRLMILIRSRLTLMTAGLWELVRDGSQVVSTHAVFASAIKQSHLLGDFLDLVVRTQYRSRKATLPKSLWDRYVDDCEARDPAVSGWRDATRVRLRSTVYQILGQVGHINNTRDLRLQNVHIARPVLDYLHDHKERYVLRCIEVGS